MTPSSRFDKIVFIIRHDIEEAFKEAIGDRIEKICAGLGVEIDYAFQALENVPEGFSAVPVTESLNILLRGLESEMARSPQRTCALPWTSAVSRSRGSTRCR